jgi:hypothetical protein
VTPAVVLALWAAGPEAAACAALAAGVPSLAGERPDLAGEYALLCSALLCSARWACAGL